MDDDPVIRDIFSRIVGRLGYQVDAACSGEEAVKIYRTALEQEGPYDLVVLDLAAEEEMGGVETCNRLHALDDGVRALVTTGYSSDPVVENCQEYGFVGALPKPFSIHELQEVIMAHLPDMPRMRQAKVS
jgi:CheY-like chemotaxis protein